jgi:hypothetical protein
VTEQADTVGSLAGAVGRQTATLRVVAQSFADQTGAGGDLARSLTELRGRMRDLGGAIAEQARGASALTADVGAVVEHLARLRHASSMHADAVAGVGSMLQGIKINGAAAGSRLSTG